MDSLMLCWTAQLGFQVLHRANAQSTHFGHVNCYHATRCTCLNKSLHGSTSFIQGNVCAFPLHELKILALLYGTIDWTFLMTGFCNADIPAADHHRYGSL